MSNGQAVAVLALKMSEPRLACVAGVPIDFLAEIAPELQGITDQICSKFLAPGIELEEGETEITSVNRKSSRAILFPLKVCITKSLSGGIGGRVVMRIQLMLVNNHLGGLQLPADYFPV